VTGFKIFYTLARPRCGIDRDSGVPRDTDRTECRPPTSSDAGAGGGAGLLSSPRLPDAAADASAYMTGQVWGVNGGLDM
jgi:hypothetical protein